MCEKERQKLAEVANQKLRRGVTREDAILALQKAGILDKNENYTKPYSHLGKCNSLHYNHQSPTE